MRGAERNLRLYPWYAAAFGAYFWLPVFFLFFNEHLPVAQVLELEAIYYGTVVLLEAPSGYFSDRVGRRITLLVAAGALVVAYALFCAATTFPIFAAAQVCLAIGLSFNSGTDTSFHFDSLAELGREADFGAREAGVARMVFVAHAVAALAGGAAALIDLRWAYALSLLAAGACLGCALFFAEPARHGQRTHSFVRQLGACVAYLRRPLLAWLFGFFVLMTVLNHIPYEFFQPYLGIALPWEQTPLATGIHTAATMLIAGWAAGRSIQLRDRWGLGWALLFTTLVQTVVIAAMGFLLHPLIAILILARSIPSAIMKPPVNAAIAPRVHQEHRATYLSLQSLAGRLSFAGVLILLSMLTGGVEGANWEALSRMLRASAALGAVGLALLLVLRPRSTASER